MPLLSFRCQHRFAAGFELDIQFEVSHRFTALFGPSGSGKTSVLLMIAGFLRPHAGRIQLADQVLLDTAAGVFLPPENRRVGMVFQDLLLFPHLTVEDNLRYGQRHRRPRFGGEKGTGPICAKHPSGRSGKLDLSPFPIPRRRVVEFSRVVEVLELGNLLTRCPQNLSGGERQRVALGRALLSGPELLLMDEPLASLDAPLKARVLAYLERVVAEWNIPTLFVTHGQAEVRRAADWVVVMERGRLVGSGTPDEALSQPAPLGWGNAAGPVNLLRLEKVEVSDQQVTARVGGQALILPPLDAAAPVPCFVQFSPADVVLSRRDVTGLSVRNHLHGRVRRVLSVHQAVFVAVDVGQILWAEVTPQAAQELDLQPGSEVTCLLKVHCLKAIG